MQFILCNDHIFFSLQEKTTNEVKIFWNNPDKLKL